MTMDFNDIKTEFKDISKSYKHYDAAFDDACELIKELVDLVDLIPLHNTDVEPHVVDAISKDVVRWLKYRICPNLEATRDYCNDVLDVLYEIIKKLE